MTKLFIGGFPLDMSELAVVQLVAPHADVLTIKLVRNKITKLCKGYGFIEVADETHALNAIAALNDTPIGDRVLTLNIVQDEPPKPARYIKNQRFNPANRPKTGPRRPRL